MTIPFDPNAQITTYIPGFDPVTRKLYEQAGYEAIFGGLPIRDDYTLGGVLQPVPRSREPFGGIAITDDPEWGDVPLEVRERRIRQCTGEPAYHALRAEDV